MRDSRGRTTQFPRSKLPASADHLIALLCHDDAIACSASRRRSPTSSSLSSSFSSSSPLPFAAPQRPLFSREARPSRTTDSLRRIFTMTIRSIIIRRRRPACIGVPLLPFFPSPRARACVGVTRTHGPKKK